jgi:outer membrane protein OmpA-like peptidoglycan-associated protein
VKRLVLLLFFSLPLFLFAQNLLMNGGFEEENICSEYQKNCAPEGWISTSLHADYYFDDAPNAQEGSHFIGLVLSSAERLNGRNFIRSRLLCGLRQGAQYKLDFFIRSLHPIFDSVGIYFSGNDFLYQKDKLRQSQPQLFLNELSLLPSKEWQKVSVVYTASGEENFIVIGDFKKRGHSLSGRPDLGRDYYFFLDSISLAPLSPQEHLCAGVEEIREEEYNFNVRHNMLDRLMYVHTKNPPPVQPAPKTIVQRVDTLTIPDVLFATNSYLLEKKAINLLQQFAEKIEASRVDSVVVEGHTDNQGTVALNQILSKNRAASVVEFLQPSIKSSFHAKGFASEKPVADNRTAEGRQKNRRVEIYVYIRE